MQITPRRTFLVRAATALSITVDSSRGLLIKLSPNQTDSKTPDCSARTAAFISVSISVRPKSTPRLGKLMPHLMGKFRMSLLPPTVLEKPIVPVKQTDDKVRLTLMKDKRY